MKQKFNELLKTVREQPLPPALLRLRFKRIAAGVLVLILTIMATVIMRDLRVLTLIIVSLYFAGMGLKLHYDYSIGNIVEYERLCLSSLKHAGVYNVTFEDENQDTQVFSSTSIKDDFFIDVMYRFYVNKNNPKLIIAYEQI